MKKLLVVTFMCAMNLATAAPPNPPEFSELDRRVQWWLDPQKPFNTILTPAFMQYYKDGTDIRNLVEPGIRDSQGELWFGRTTASSVNVYQHKITSLQPEWAGQPGANTHRSEVLADTRQGNAVAVGQQYWMAYSVMFGADMFGTGTDSVALLDFHGIPDSWSDPKIGWPSGLSSPQIYLNRSGRLSLITRRDADPTTPKQDPSVNGIENLYVLDSATKPGVWYRLIFNFKMHWDSTQNPFFKVWMQRGDGSLVQVINETGPNHWPQPNIPWYFQKFGLYKWDSTWSGTQSRTMWVGGVYLVKDDPGVATLDLNVMRALLP